MLLEFRDHQLRFRNKWSALLPLCFGLASMQLPVLVLTIIEEWLVAANDKLFGNYPSAALKWSIAHAVQKAVQNTQSSS